MTVNVPGENNVSSGGEIIPQAGTIGQMPPDNSNIRSETTNQPDTTERRNYVNVLNQNIYEFMSNAYFGEGGFRDGSYLIPHTRELFYDDRRAMVFYKNYLAPIINAMVDPVFKTYIERKVIVGGNEMEEGLPIQFLGDVDNGGTDMQAFSKEVMLYAELHGIVFVVVDNHPRTAETIAEVEETREFPYAYLKYAYQVPAVNKKKTLGWETDQYGNLLWITFYEGEKEFVNENTKISEKKKIYSYWSKDIFYRFYLSDDKEVQIHIDKDIPLNLKTIPVIPVFGGKRKNPRNILTSPPFYDIAKVNHAIFNKDSEIRDQERAQGFAVFYTPSPQAGNMNIGAHNVIYPPLESPFPPGFAAPPAEILTGLNESVKAMTAELFAMANQRGVTGVQTAKSGVALEWEFSAEENNLLRISQIAEATEEKIMSLFQEWTGLVFEYNAEYPDSFKPTSDREDLTLIDQTLLMGMPPKAASILKKIAFRTITRKEDENEVAEAMEEFNGMTEPEDMNRGSIENNNGADYN